MRENSFLVCSVCDEIVSSYAQCAIKSFRNFRKITQKFQIKMQIYTIRNKSFEKPFRKPSNRTKVSFLKKNFFEVLSKKIWFRVCSVTAKMLEPRNSGENLRKRSEIFFENLPRAHKNLI